MSRFLIHVSDSWTPDLNPKEELLFSMAEFAEFIRLTKETDAYADFSNNISLKCEICGSFIITTESIYRTIAKINNRLTPDFEAIDYVFYKILIPVTLTNEQWEKYQRGSIKLKPVDPNVDPIYEYCDGFQFVSEECVFIFDRAYSCNSVMEGKVFE